MKPFKTTYRTLSVIVILAFIVSCSPVKYVPKESYLLNKVELKVTDNTVSKEDADSYVRQKENLRILGFLKFHLWLYNLSSKKKTNDWLKRIGEEPVVYNDLLTQRSDGQLKQYFRNRGYYDAQVENKLTVNEKKRKANLKYLITPGQPYKIRKINYHLNDSSLRTVFYSDTTTKAIKTGQLFDVGFLENERNRLTTLFKNNGYYDFGKDMIYYVVDTSLYSNWVDIDMHIKEKGNNQKPYYINKFIISVFPNISFNERDTSVIVNKSDTLVVGDYTIISGNGQSYNPNLFAELNNLKSGGLYRVEDVQKTFNAFSSLNQFRFVNIQFKKPDESEDGNLLDCIINIAPMTKQSVSVDIEGTNTSGNMGVAGNLNYQHRNLFRNAEVFRINLKGAMEHQQWMVENVINDFNTREAGTEASLSVSKLLGPGNWFRYFDKFLPQTVFTLGFNYQDRPDYTRTIANFKVGYNWKTSEMVGHTLNLIDFNMVNLYAFDPVFINSIKDLYIKSSFTDHLIFASNYTLVYNTQLSTERKNYKYAKFSVESSGNVLNLLSSVFGASKTENMDSTGVVTSRYYKFLNTRYAQYVKADFEFRYGYMIDKYNSLVGRAFAGIGLPFGNFDVLPFEKKYFTGGANGIRAWQVRSLGPGTYKAPADAYPNQSSDIKLEANLEYRFRIIKMLELALFLDAGNIWAVNDKDNREGAKFEINKFYRQFAIGTGTGFRFDFEYFIFRFDLGLKLRDPSLDLANGWIIGNRRLNNDDFNISFAIGYPF